MAVIARLNGTATFDSTQLNEVYNISFDWGGGASTARSKAAPFNANGGTVSMELFGSVATSLWGKYGQLQISGTGISLTCNALCTSVGVSAQVNDAARNTVTFQIIQ